MLIAASALSSITSRTHIFLANIPGTHILSFAKAKYVDVLQNQSLTKHKVVIKS